jgi:hypothetical protein
MATLDDVAGGPFSRLVQDQLQVERSLSASLAQRGLAIVTTSGALATLLSAFTGFSAAGRSQPLPIPGAGRALVFLAIVAFLLAASLGILANIWPRYREVPVDWLESHALPAPSWTGQGSVDAASIVANELKDILHRYRQANRHSLDILRTAVAFEILAIAALAGAVLSILLASA